MEAVSLAAVEGLSRVSMNKECGKDSCKQRVPDRLCAHHSHNVLAGGYSGFVFFRTATILEPHSKKYGEKPATTKRENHDEVLVHGCFFLLGQRLFANLRAKVLGSGGHRDSMAHH